MSARAQTECAEAVPQRADQPCDAQNPPDRPQQSRDARRPWLCADPAPGPDPMPKAKAYKSKHGDREAAVYIHLLRQISNLALVRETDMSAQWLQGTNDSLQKRALTAPVRPHHREQRTGLNSTVDMMHSRMAIVAERQILERNGHAVLGILLRQSRHASPRHRQVDERPDQGGKTRHNGKARADASCHPGREPAISSRA